MSEKVVSRLPIKSATGMTVALMSVEGVQLWVKRTKRWETFSIEFLVKMHSELLQAQKGAPLPEQPERA